MYVEFVIIFSMGVNLMVGGFNQKEVVYLYKQVNIY